jgi:hypothetical protein
MMPSANSLPRLPIGCRMRPSLRTTPRWCVRARFGILLHRHRSTYSRQFLRRLFAFTLASTTKTQHHPTPLSTETRRNPIS